MLTVSLAISESTLGPGQALRTRQIVFLDGGWSRTAGDVWIKQAPGPHATVLSFGSSKIPGVTTPQGTSLGQLVQSVNVVILG